MAEEGKDKQGCVCLRLLTLACQQHPPALLLSRRVGSREWRSWPSYRPSECRCEHQSLPRHLEFSDHSMCERRLTILLASTVSTCADFAPLVALDADSSSPS